jgi:hypothetical protein
MKGNLFYDWCARESHNCWWVRLICEPKLFLSISLTMGALGLLSLLVLPIILARIPPNHFVKVEPNMQRWSLGWFYQICRNLFGGVLLLLGIAMLVLPGQGVLTILVALFFLEFPGKRRVVLWLLRHSRVRNTVNKLRKRQGCEPLQLEFPTADADRSDRRGGHA